MRRVGLKREPGGRSRLARRTSLRKLGSKASQKKELDKLCRELVFRRDGNRCVKCGKATNLQWSHVYTRRLLSLRWDPDNSKTLCGGCHLWWGQNPLDAAVWFAAAWPSRFERLRMKRQFKQKVDMKAIELGLKQQS